MTMKDLERPPRERIAALLGGVTSAGSFTARRTAPADSLHLEVRGVGPLRLPVTTAQARQLCQIARPARYGLGELTLLDRRVRDTWEVPLSRVKIDKRRWNGTLQPMVAKLAADLGVPAGARLRPVLQSMLVYARGQFFRSHQDSAKADDMIASLVVTLPSSFKGGTLEVEHRGETVSYRSSKHLSLVAFWADCRHQIRPVRSGHRIVLTYNLLLDGDATVRATSLELRPEVVDGIANRLGEHFDTPARSRWRGGQEGLPPNRLVCLLDHEYTARGLSWSRLKGADAARAAALQAAADRAGCDVALGLADVHETWSCIDEYWDGWRHRPLGRRQWYDGFDDDGEDVWLDDDEPDGYQLDELIDWSITLDRCTDPSGSPAEPIAARVSHVEVCESTPSVNLAPYLSEYEGYMGNYGNTMDRWYRRAAIVVWPRQRAFTVHAEGLPRWALTALDTQIKAGNLAAAREQAATVGPLWSSAVREAEPPKLMAPALRVAAALDEPALARALLAPFRVESLTPRHARGLVALASRYGEPWMQAVVAGWSARPPGLTGSQDRAAWIASVPKVCAALDAADPTGAVVARLLLEPAWAWIGEMFEQSLAVGSPSRREDGLADLAAPIVGLLDGAATVGASDDLSREVIARLCTDPDDRLLGCAVHVVRRAAATMTPGARAAAGIDTIARHCRGRLAARLARPPRAADDWSLAVPGGCGCGCELCGTLAGFLADPARRQLEWPLAKDRRRHVHSTIERAELPVGHQTRRIGRPYTLVLTKTAALFEREAEARRRDEADLAWLDAHLDAHGDTVAE